MLDQPLIGALAFAVGLGVAAFAYFRTPSVRVSTETLVAGPDYALVGAALSLNSDPIALTTAEGSLLLVNAAYRERFGGAHPPLELGASSEASQGLKLALTMAERDGAGCVAGIETSTGVSPIEVTRAGTHNDLLLWHFVKPASADPVKAAANRLRGRVGDLFGQAGVLAAIVDPTARSSPAITCLKSGYLGTRAAMERTTSRT